MGVLFFFEYETENRCIGVRLDDREPQVNLSYGVLYRRSTWRAPVNLIYCVLKTLLTLITLQIRKGRSERTLPGQCQSAVYDCCRASECCIWVLPGLGKIPTGHCVGHGGISLPASQKFRRGGWFLRSNHRPRESSQWKSWPIQTIKIIRNLFHPCNTWRYISSWCKYWCKNGHKTWNSLGGTGRDADLDWDKLKVI